MFRKGGIDELTMSEGYSVFFATPHEQTWRELSSEGPGELSFLGVGRCLGSAPRCPAAVQVWTQWMPCLGQPSSLAKAPLQLLLSAPYSRHLFRPGTPDRQPMKPCVVFGTGGEGRTWEGDAGSATWAAAGGPGPARGLVWKAGKPSQGPEAQAQPVQSRGHAHRTRFCSGFDS